VKIKSRGEWKSLSSLSVKIESEWRKAHYAYVCRTSYFDDDPVTGNVVVVDTINRVAALSLDSIAYTLTANAPTFVRKVDGTYFQGTLGFTEVSGSTYPAVSWTADTVNPPVDGTDFFANDPGEVQPLVYQWVPVYNGLRTSLDGDDLLFGEGAITPLGIDSTSDGDQTTYVDDDYNCILFGTVGTSTLKVTQPGFCDIVVVGGGGGGGPGGTPGGYRVSSGAGSGGGGGGGQVVYAKNVWLPVGEYEVVVGAGGRGAGHGLPATTGYTLPSLDLPAESGAISSFYGYRAFGGGAGGRGTAVNGSGLATAGASGGNGGGGGTSSDGKPGGSTNESAQPESENHDSLQVFGNPGNAGGVSALSTEWGPGGDGGSSSLPPYYPGGVEPPVDDPVLRYNSALTLYEGTYFRENRALYVPGFDATNNIYFADLPLGVGGAGGQPSTDPPSSPAYSGVDGIGEGGQGHYARYELGAGNGGSGCVYIVAPKHPTSGLTLSELIENENPTVLIPEAGEATGGTEDSAYPDWVLHTYDTPGTYSFDVTLAGVFDIFVLAGGGGGFTPGDTTIGRPSRFASSGGPGGSVFLDNVFLSVGSYTVTVGSGGVGAVLLYSITDSMLAYRPESYLPTKGGDSSISGVVHCYGGGSGSGNIIPTSAAVADLGVSGFISPIAGGCGSTPSVASRFPVDRFDYRIFASSQPGGVLFAGISVPEFDNSYVGSYAPIDISNRLVSQWGDILTEDGYVNETDVTSLDTIPDSIKIDSWMSHVITNNPGIGKYFSKVAYTSNLTVPAFYSPGFVPADVVPLQATGAGGDGYYGRRRGVVYVDSASPGGNGLVVIARRV